MHFKVRTIEGAVENQEPESAGCCYAAIDRTFELSRRLDRCRQPQAARPDPD
jgi:hypothetical protein